MTLARGDTVAISIAADETEAFALVGGMQVSRIQLLHRPVVQNAVSENPWQQYAPITGKLALRVEGTGLLLEGEAQDKVWNLAVGLGRGWFRLNRMPREIVGEFVILKYEILGRSGQLQQFTLQLESAAKPSWSS